MVVFIVGLFIGMFLGAYFASYGFRVKVNKSVKSLMVWAKAHAHKEAD